MLEEEKEILVAIQAFQFSKICIATTEGCSKACFEKHPKLAVFNYPAELDFGALAAKGRDGESHRSNPDHSRTAGSGRPRRRPKFLDFNGLCDRKGVFEFNAQISDCAVHLCVA